MIGPEPHQPLDKSNLGAERGGDTKSSLFEIDWPPGVRHCFGGHLRHFARCLCAILHHGERIGGLSLGFLFFFRADSFGLPLRIRVGDRSESLGARRQVAGHDLGRRGSVELSNQRPSRIGLDSRDRSRTRAHPEPMQGQRGLRICGSAHGTAPEDGCARRRTNRRGEAGRSLRLVVLRVVAVGDLRRKWRFSSKKRGKSRTLVQTWSAGSAAATAGLGSERYWGPSATRAIMPSFARPILHSAVPLTKWAI